jgi:serine/threonine-protein kinase
MGEVYKARDTKLGREVAIKVLPEAFAENKERLARFEREARLLASLNHPNIATLFDLQESDGTHFLVLEFVPGETLAERIKRGPIPADEALPLFKQIAEGLEAAHEKGVVHRDLKPANIKVTPEGKAKVLDFGLAKAMAGEVPDQGLSESPTMTRGATEAGILLGTAPYMSPEQARGKVVDKRTDIWAFGCCLYEVLTGKTAFLGETVSDTFVAVLDREPDWNAMPESTPAMVRSLLRRCIQKDPTRRVHDIADARVELEEALTQPWVTTQEVALVTRRPPSAATHAIAAMIAAVVTGLVVWFAVSPGAPTARNVARFDFHAPEGLAVSRSTRGSTVAISADGKVIVYAVRSGESTELRIRSMGELEFQSLPGSEGAEGPFFSPDGQWVGFFADGMLKKVSLTGGAVTTLCQAPNPRGASWGFDGAIIFAPTTNTGLNLVPADGGMPHVLTHLDPERGERTHRWPELLPGGKWILVTTLTRAIDSYDEARIEAVSLDTGERRVLIDGGTFGKERSWRHRLMF